MSQPTQTDDAGKMALFAAREYLRLAGEEAVKASDEYSRMGDHQMALACLVLAQEILTARRTL